jgi:hypothetical protein
MFSDIAKQMVKEVSCDWTGFTRDSNRKGKGAFDVSHYVVKFSNEKAKDRDCSEGAACMSVLDGDQSITNLVVFVPRYKKIPYFEVAEPYLEWLLNESVYAPVFLTKCPVFVLENGVEIDCSVDYSLVKSALIAMRLWEFPARAKFMQECFKVSNDMGKSWLLSTTVRLELNGDYVFQKSTCGHSAFESEALSVEAFKRFLKGKYTPANYSLTDRQKMKYVNVMFKPSKKSPTICEDDLSSWSGSGKAVKVLRYFELAHEALTENGEKKRFPKDSLTNLMKNFSLALGEKNVKG